MPESTETTYFAPFPKAIYFADGRTDTVKDQEELDKRLGEGWSTEAPEPKPHEGEDKLKAGADKLKDAADTLKDAADKLKEEPAGEAKTKPAQAPPPKGKDEPKSEHDPEGTIGKRHTKQ